LTSFKITSLQGQVVWSVSHFVYEIVEFGIFLGHRQSSILSNKPLDKVDVTSRLLFVSGSRSDKCATQKLSKLHWKKCVTLVFPGGELLIVTERQHFGARVK
jgi:hypothetical protein